jgi:hypothetical protein
MSRQYRNLWAIAMLAWFIGTLTLSWDYVKCTWLLFGFISAHGRRIRAGDAQLDGASDPRFAFPEDNGTHFRPRVTY